MSIICPRCGKEITADANFCPFCVEKIREPIFVTIPEPAPVPVFEPVREPAKVSCYWCGKDAKHKVYIKETGKTIQLCEVCYCKYTNEQYRSGGSEFPWASIIEVSSVIFLIIAVFTGAGIGSVVDSMTWSGADKATFLGGFIGLAIGVVSVAQSMAIAKILRKVTFLTDKFKDK